MTDDTPRDERHPIPPRTTARVEEQHPTGTPGPQGGLRASDLERDRCADILGEALSQGRLTHEEHAERVSRAYDARTLGELDALVSDLPEGQRPRHEPPLTLPPPGPAHITATFSSASRRGRWRVGQRLDVTAYCGSVELDLTEAFFEYPLVVVNARTVCGSIEIRVPENITVRDEGSGIFGSFEAEHPSALEPPDESAPTVLVRGTAICGAVEVKPKRGKRLENLRRLLR
ncbi:DUF1707 domain-containing protein [Streptomyces sp. NPDC005438]|uniref:DUF1707 SHOCT-like domain-containing protein n=1 Tax=Streptomyces sp. NPDC005438 TaxID=3156880 RepID=UPI0033B1F7C6